MRFREIVKFIADLLSLMPHLQSWVVELVRCLPDGGLDEMFQDNSHGVSSSSCVLWSHFQDHRNASRHGHLTAGPSCMASKSPFIHYKNLR